MPQRVLLTGGSGYIGSRVMAALAAREDVEEIVNVDLRPPPAPIPKVAFVERSVTEDLRDLFDGPRRIDLAMHLAWTVDPLRDARRQREICIGGTGRFLAGCAAASVPHVFFTSSATAYGAHPEHANPLEETAPLRPEYHFQYSAEKREAEGLFRRYAEEHPGTLLQIARPCVVAGPNVSNFIFRSIQKSPTLRPAWTDSRVQLVHEDDCAAAIVAIVLSRLPGAFNLAADGLVTLSEVYRRLGVQALPVPLPVMYGIAALAWRLGATRLSEAPPGFIYFIAYPWLVSNRRVKEEVGYQFRYHAQEVLDSLLATWAHSQPAR